MICLERRRLSDRTPVSCTGCSQRFCLTKCVFLRDRLDSLTDFVLEMRCEIKKHHPGFSEEFINFAVNRK
jgi:hypothetical protein